MTGVRKGLNAVTEVGEGSPQPPCILGSPDFLAGSSARSFGPWGGFGTAGGRGLLVLCESLPAAAAPAVHILIQFERQLLQCFKWLSVPASTVPPGLAAFEVRS